MKLCIKTLRYLKRIQNMSIDNKISLDLERALVSYQDNLEEEDYLEDIEPLLDEKSRAAIAKTREVYEDHLRKLEDLELIEHIKSTR